MLKGKHILLGVTGSIAAYKSAMLIRLLVKEGAEVKVIMTEMAKKFITPLTLATLSKNPILVDFFNPENGEWNSHVSLGIWADLYIIAPASANTLAKMACGVADNLLLTTYLSSRCPVVAAPAMDLDMFRHPATVKNLELLRSRGVRIIEPAAGELASGLDGKGRMEEPEKIVTRIDEILSESKRFSGRRVLITAGPTREAIDPVRYISNHSTGKMGYALADAFAGEGAVVTVVSGPVSVSAAPSVTVRKVITASEMYDATVDEFSKGYDVTILCAAVADYKPKCAADKKIKSSSPEISIELTPTADIAAAIGKLKKDKEILVGFALETNDEISHAKAKLVKKNLDMIVLNSLNDKGAGFATDTNKVTILLKDGTCSEYQLKSKEEVAADILEQIFKFL